MSRRDRQRLEDISAAITAIAAHLQRGNLSDGLVFDAVRVRLIEIGEAVKALPENALASEDQIPWADIARMRDLLAHRYFDTSHSILQATVDHDLPALMAQSCACSKRRTRLSHRIQDDRALLSPKPPT